MRSMTESVTMSLSIEIIIMILGNEIEDLLLIEIIYIITIIIEILLKVILSFRMTYFL